LLLIVSLYTMKPQPIESRGRDDPTGFEPAAYRCASYASTRIALQSLSPPHPASMSVQTYQSLAYCMLKSMPRQEICGLSAGPCNEMQWPWRDSLADTLDGYNEYG